MLSLLGLLRVAILLSMQLVVVQATGDFGAQNATVDRSLAISLPRVHTVSHCNLNVSLRFCMVRIGLFFDKKPESPGVPKLLGRYT